ncbi:Hsp20/alpha crystallin family protein [Bacillus salacetis]|uniref:Hsp20/alpha crystallin family protein n=1 Tax=Bacillus salacetis TaxID=2315464 RepID=A0A3A1R4X8_9BACI|nr:Hsp20/alpha crystallin family protein [Bacillus salacetis]RIW35055.1 Hsp20/alpha crystallin family protein [Bacillus salacetis]
MFPWNSFFPFNKNMKDMMKNMNPQDVDQYVKGVMHEMFPKDWQGMQNPGDLMKNMGGMMNGFNGMNGSNEKAGEYSPDGQDDRQHNEKIPVNIFESLESIYIQLKISDEELVKNMKVFHTSNQAILENIPSSGERQVITLPSLVKKKGSSAQYKEGILEIKIPKSIDLQFTEIDVSER